MPSVDTPTPTRRSIDYGRVVAVAIFSCLMLVNGIQLLGHQSPADDPLGFAAGVMTMMFFVLLVGAYLRRAPSSRTDLRWTSWLVAFAGTCAPFTIPLVSAGPRADGLVATAAAAVLALGLLAMLWALGALGTNISVVPQARVVVTHGPYGWVRHPLYSAEILNVVGICLAMAGVGPWIVLGALVAFQIMRARREESLLTQELPGYAEYKARTPMLVPMIGRT